MLKTSEMLKADPLRSTASNRLVRVGLPSLALVLLCYGLFLYLSAPNYTVRLTPTRIDDYTTINSIFKSASGDFYYTGDQVYFQMARMPRYLPLKLDFNLSLDRPASAQPAQVVINEVEPPDYKLVRPLATFSQTNGQTGYQTYSVVVPPRPESKYGLTVELKVNPYQPAGENGNRGVAIRDLRIQNNNPTFFESDAALYSFDILGLMLIIGLWLYLAGLGYVEIGLLSLLTAITAAEETQALHIAAGWSLACLVGLALATAGWYWWRRQCRTGELLWVGAGLVCISAFFIVGNIYYDDAKLYQDWIASINKFGPFDIYHNDITLNYPPLIVYFFWVYGAVANLLGLGGNMVALKVVVSLAIPALLWLVWKFLREHTGLSKAELDRRLVPAFLLFSLNLHTLFNAVIWGQTEILLSLALVLCLYLVYRKAYFAAIVLLGLCLLLKLQTIMAGPLLFILILRRYGWRRTIQAGVVTAVIMAVLALPIFGFRPNEISRYLFQAELGGQTMNFSRVYNFQYLLTYLFGQTQIATGLGLVVVILTYLTLIRWIWNKGLSILAFSLIAATGVMTFFTFAIKVHERYIYYTVPFLLIALCYSYLNGFYPRQVRVLFLLLSLNGILQLFLSRFTDYFAIKDPTKEGFKIINSMQENVYNWTGWLIDARTPLEISLDLFTIGLCGWIGYLAYQAVKSKLTDKALPAAEPVN